jgi:superfamily I DNA/RNA helicase
MEEKPITDIDPALIFPGPIALVAGPGSGKTSRLALRIKHLVVERKVDPATIAVITFKALRNSKKRRDCFMSR